MFLVLIVFLFCFFLFCLPAHLFSKELEKEEGTELVVEMIWVELGEGETMIRTY